MAQAAGPARPTPPHNLVCTNANPPPGPTTVPGTTVKLAWQHANAFEFRIYIDGVLYPTTTKSKNIQLDNQVPGKTHLYGVSVYTNKMKESAVPTIPVVVPANNPPPSGLVGFYYNDAADGYDTAQDSQLLAKFLSGQNADGSPSGVKGGKIVTAQGTNCYGGGGGQFSDIATANLNAVNPPAGWKLLLSQPICPGSYLPNARTDAGCSITSGNDVVLDPAAVPGDVGQTVQVAGSGTSTLAGYYFLGYVSSVNPGVGYTLDRNAPQNGTAMHFFVGNSLYKAVVANAPYFSALARINLDGFNPLTGQPSGWSGMGAGNTIYRIGWEINGNAPNPDNGTILENGHYPWTYFPGPDVAKAWSYVKGLFKAVDATCLMDYNVNGLGPKNQKFQDGFDQATWVPWADVDIFSIDEYFHTGEGGHAEYGLGHVIPWIKLAQANGKAWAMPEWGANGPFFSGPCTTPPIPTNVQTPNAQCWFDDMVKLIKGQTVTDRQTGEVFTPTQPAAYQAYFSTNDKGINLNLEDPPNLPAAQAYANAFGV